MTPSVTKIEIRDSSKVSDFINSFTQKTKGNVIKVGKYLFKSYN